MDMVCNWILPNYLPKKFWYFGVNAAAHVSNYMPISTDDGIHLSPFELVYDFFLLPMSNRPAMAHATS
eukprot:13526705-Ditylum_brightwellii.AAC.1